MSRTSRRQFAKTLAASGAMLPLSALGQAEVPVLHRAMAEVVKAQHGKHLDDADLERIGATLQEHATLLERLRAFPLKNSDEPDFTFSSLTKRW